MNRMLITAIALALSGTAMIACTKDKNNNPATVTQPASESVSNPQEESPLVDEEKKELTYSVQSLSRDKASANVALAFTVPTEDGRFELTDYQAQLTAENGMYHVSKPIQLKHAKKTVQVAFLCALRSYPTEDNSCVLYSRVYVLNQQQEFEPLLTVYQVYPNSNTLAIAPEDNSESLVETMKLETNGRKFTFNEFYKLASEWSVPRADLKTIEKFDSNNNDDLGNPLKRIDDSLQISIPLSYIDLPAEFDNEDLASHQVIVTNRYYSKYFSTTPGTSFQAQGQGRLSEQPDSEKFSHKSLRYDYPTAASNFPIYAGRARGLQFQVRCKSYGCKKIHVMVREIRTSTENKWQAIGAFEFVQDNENQTHWKMKAYTRKPGLSFNELDEVFARYGRRHYH